MTDVKQAKSEPLANIIAWLQEIEAAAKQDGFNVDARRAPSKQKGAWDLMVFPHGYDQVVAKQKPAKPPRPKAEKSTKEKPEKSEAAPSTSNGSNVKSDASTFASTPV